MKQLRYGHCLAGVAIAVVLLLALGVSPGSLGWVAVVLACPLMMFVMMRMMMGGSQHRAVADDEPVAPDEPR